MLSVIIVDDERLAIQRLEKILNSIQVVNVIGTYTNGYEALPKIIKNKPDLIFLDINMSVISGIEMARRIKANNQDSRIVFVTAFEKYAIKAFELGAEDYVLKPFSKERIHKIIHRFHDISSRKPTDNKQYMIHAFKYFHITKNGIELKDIKWRTTKARELFIYLVQHSNEVVRKDILLDLFWPDTDMNKGYENLYTTIYQLRRALEEMGAGIKIMNSNHGYKLDLNGVKYDVHEWKKAIEQFDYEFHESKDLYKILKAYNKIKHYYIGHYLEEESNSWKENMKEQYKIVFLSKSRDMIELLQENEKYLDAQLISLHIQEIYPYIEYPYFTLMQLYSKTGDRYNVKKQYDNLKKMLEEEFGAKPNAKTYSWYQEWMQNNSLIGQ